MSDHCRCKALPKATPLQFNKALESTHSRSGKILILNLKYTYTKASIRNATVFAGTTFYKSSKSQISCSILTVGCYNDYRQYILSDYQEPY